MVLNYIKECICECCNKFDLFTLKVFRSTNINLVKLTSGYCIRTCGVVCDGFRLEDFEVDCEVDCEEDWEIVVYEAVVCEAGVWLRAAVTVDLNLVGRFTTSRFASVCCRLEGVLVLGPSTRGGYDWFSDQVH